MGGLVRGLCAPLFGDSRGEGWPHVEQVTPLSAITNLSATPTSMPPAGTSGEIMAVRGIRAPQTTSLRLNQLRPPAGSPPCSRVRGIWKPTIDSLTKLFGNQNPHCQMGSLVQPGSSALHPPDEWLLSSVIHKASIQPGPGRTYLALREKGPVQNHSAGGYGRNLGNIITRRLQRLSHCGSILQAVGGHEGLGPTSQRRQRRGGQKKTGGGRGAPLTKRSVCQAGGGQLPKAAVHLVHVPMKRMPQPHPQSYSPPFGPEHPTAPADRRVVSGPSPRSPAPGFDESSVCSATSILPGPVHPLAPTGLTPQHLRGT